MTYDLHGSWNDKSSVSNNAPLYDQVGSPVFSVHGRYRTFILLYHVVLSIRFLISVSCFLSQVVRTIGWKEEHQGKNKHWICKCHSFRLSLAVEVIFFCI